MLRLTNNSNTLLLAGGKVFLSVLAIRGLLDETSSPVAARALAEQWAGIYHRGKVLGPGAAVLSLLGYGFLAYQRRVVEARPGGGRFVVAAALTMAIVPFTKVFMAPTNQALLDAADGTRVLGAAAVRELLVRWKDLNVVRALFPLAGAVVGLFALVG